MRRFSPLLLILASSSCYAGVGPTIGYTQGRGSTYGWEANLGTPVLYLTGGQAWRPGPSLDAEEPETERLGWFGVESWAAGSLTVAAADTTLDDLTHLNAGIGGAWPIEVPKISGSPDPNNFVIVLGVGWRWLAGANETFLSLRAGYWLGPESKPVPQA